MPLSIVPRGTGAQLKIHISFSSPLIIGYSFSCVRINMTADYRVLGTGTCNGSRFLGTKTLNWDPKIEQLYSKLLGSSMVLVTRYTQQSP